MQALLRGSGALRPNVPMLFVFGMLFLLGHTGRCGSSHPEKGEGPHQLIRR